MRKSVIVLLSVCAMTSCGKEDVEPQGLTGGEREKVAVVDGVLHFATTGDYFDFSVEMANKDPEERRAWEERNGFTSMLTFAEDVMGDPELRYGEALARPEIFSVSSDSVIDIEVPITLASVANKTGYFFIGDALSRIDRFQMVTSSIGDKNAVDEVFSGCDGLTNDHISTYNLYSKGGLKSTVARESLSMNIRNSSEGVSANRWEESY